MAKANKKKIGIVGYVSNGSFGVGVAYMEFFSSFGDVTIISHTETTIREELDLLVIPGGPDVDVTRYLKEGEKVSLAVGSPCVFRERFDRELLPKYVENGTPIFGICRGHQSLAVYFGGTLHQDMWHETNPSGNRKAKVHEVDMNTDFLSTIGIELRTQSNKLIRRQRVNSIHHQAVDKIPTNAVEIANYHVNKDSYSEQPMNEALYYPDINIASVQWHPEEIQDDLSVFLIMNLLKM